MVDSMGLFHFSRTRWIRVHFLRLFQGGRGAVMPEAIEQMDGAVDSAASNENQPAGDSPKTFTQSEVDAIVKGRIDKQNARHATELDELRARLDEAERAKSEADERLAKLDAERERAEWAAAASAATGVSASILRGNSAEEYLAHANEIKAAMPVAPVIPDGSARPTVSKESILEITNEKERLAAIRANVDLFR